MKKEELLVLVAVILTVVLAAISLFSLPSRQPTTVDDDFYPQPIVTPSGNPGLEIVEGISVDMSTGEMQPGF